MKIAKSRKESQEANPDTGPITAANYLPRVSAFLRLGAVPFVIRAFEGDKGSIRTRELATEPQWIAWRSWFISKGMPVGFMTAHGLATVPSEYPELFDKDAPVSDPFARLPRKSTQQMEEMRGRLSGLFAGLTREVGAWPSEGRRKMPSREEQRVSAQDRLMELAAERDRPSTLSSEARKAIGLMVPPSQREGEDIDF